ncbi:MAG: cytochrome c [Actinobacteria bacterium]|nr:cytochrome c [Actinomycetota bacterium]
MSDNLTAAAEALGLPEALVRRSAEARAAETGGDVEEILAAWAGGEAPAPSPAPAEEPEEKAAEEDAEPEERIEEPAEEKPAAEAPQPPPVERPAPAAATAPAAPPPAPAEVTPQEAARVPVVVTVPTSQIKERTSFSFPRWLTGALIVAPLFALFALGSSATGACGEATELRTDVITGEIVNCDGSEFTGQAVGGGGDFLALGESVYAGGAVAGVNCAGCHAASGQGLGTFPPLTGVLTTFGSCADHVEWVALGTQGFQNAGRSSYGDTAKPLGGGGQMPGFGTGLSPEQIAAVAAFERVRFGGANPEAALVDCGLVEQPPEETGAPGEGPAGEGGEEGDSGAGEETVTEGGDTTTTTP